LDEFEKDPESFIAKFKEDEKDLQERIVSGKELLRYVKITRDYIEIIARITRNIGVEGHRSDIAILKTAKTIAAFNKHWKVEIDDLEEAILLVLGEISQCDNQDKIQNQIQQAQNQMNDEDEEDSDDNDEDQNDDLDFQDSLADDDHDQEDSNEDDSFGDDQDSDDSFDNEDNQKYDNDYNDNYEDNNYNNDYNQNNNDNDENDNEIDENNNVNNDNSDDENNNDSTNENQFQADVNDSDESDDQYQVDYNENKAEKEIDEFDMETLEKDIRKMLVMEGREKEKAYGNRVESKSEKGKYVKSKYSPNISSSDIAIDATLRAAALNSKKKDNSNNLKVEIKNQDIREKVRKHKARASVAIVVDLSGSMINEKKVNKIRGILDRVIKNINRNRDKLSVIGFKGQGSEIIIPNTKRPSSFLDKLNKITVGGTTPMAAGLEKAFEILKNEKKREEFIPMLILLSDGMPNVGLDDSNLKKVRGNPVKDVLAIGQELGENGIYTIVIDFEKKHKHGRNINMELAFLSNGRYYDLENVYDPEIAIDKILTYERAVL
jgi:magnesium chelatase subunit D